jgi:hypothetical protein
MMDVCDKNERQFFCRGLDGYGYTKRALLPANKNASGWSKDSRITDLRFEGKSKSKS